jgi:hypothetical protein
MADFRRVALNTLKWFPQSRKTVPVTPVRVQVPPSPCAITLLPGRYAIELTLAGHAAHDAFAEFVGDVEQHALEHARPSSQGLTWYSCFSAYSLIPTLRLSAFDDTKFFDAAGLPCVAPPTDFKACACVLELTGAWTTDASWGLRWKVLEVKHVTQPLVPPTLFVDDDADSPRSLPQAPMFIDDDA